MNLRKHSTKLRFIRRRYYKAMLEYICAHPITSYLCNFAVYNPGIWEDYGKPDWKKFPEVQIIAKDAVYVRRDIDVLTLGCSCVWFVNDKQRIRFLEECISLTKGMRSGKSYRVPRAYQAVEIEGIEMEDYPDFCDAYITYAEHSDGTPLTEVEMDELNYDSELVAGLVWEKLH